MQSRKVWIVAAGRRRPFVACPRGAARATCPSCPGAARTRTRSAKSISSRSWQQAKIKMVEENWDGGVGTLRTKIKGGNNNWDVVQVEVGRAAASAARKVSTKSSTGPSSAARTSTCRTRSTTAASAPSSTASCSPTTATRSRRRAEELGRLLEPAEVAGQARAAQGAEDDAGDRADGRRRRAEGRLQDARHRRRRRARVQEARPDQGRTWCGGKRARSRRSCSPPARW